MNLIKTPCLLTRRFFFNSLIKNYFLNKSFKAFAGLNAGDLLAAILIFSPVAGLIPVLAFLALTTNLPKPEISVVTFLANFHKNMFTEF